MNKAKETDKEWQLQTQKLSCHIKKIEKYSESLLDISVHESQL